MENVTGVWDYKAIIDKRPATVNMRDMFTAKPYQDDSKCLGFKISTLKEEWVVKEFSKYNNTYTIPRLPNCTYMIAFQGFSTLS